MGRGRRAVLAVAALVAGAAWAGGAPDARAGAPASLAPKWHFTTPVKANEPALYQSRVIVTSGNVAQARALANGAQLWRTKVPDQLGFAVQLGEPVVFDNAIDTALAIAPSVGTATFDPNTGAATLAIGALHSIRLTRAVDGSLDALVGGGFAPPNEVVYLLGFAGHTWLVDAGPSLPPPSTPRISGGRAFVAIDDMVLGFDPAQPCQPTPNPAWCYPTWSHALSGKPQRPSFGGTGRIAVGDDNGVVTVLDAATGNEVWHDFFNQPQAPTTYANGVIYVADDLVGVLRAIDATTGNVLWTGNTGRAVGEIATVAANRVWLASEDGRVFAFAQNGCPSGSCTPVDIGDSGTGAAAAGGPLVSNGVVVAAFGTKVVAFATG